MFILSAFEIYRVESLEVDDGRAYWSESFSGETVSLEGSWIFTHEDSDDKEEILIHVPGVWNQIFTDGRGRATYQCSIFFPADNCPEYIEISAKAVIMRYRLWINGEYTGSSSTHRKMSPDNPRAAVFSFNPVPGENTITYEVENDTHVRGGILEPVLINDSGRLGLQMSRLLSFELIIFGCMIFLALFQIVLHVIRINDSRKHLFFGVCILFMALGNIVRSRFPIYDLWPDIPYLLMKKSQFALFFLGAYFFVRVNPLSETKKSLKLFSKITEGVLLLQTIIFIILPFYKVFYLAFTFYPVILIYIFLLMIDCLKKAVAGSLRELINLCGLVFMLFGVCHDSVDVVFARYDWQIMPYSTWIYALFVTVYMAIDFAVISAEAQESQKALLSLSEDIRSGIGRELHDGVGQLTHGLEYLSAGYLRQNECTPEVLKLINKTSKDINARIRLMINEYYPEPDGFSLQLALDELIKRFCEIYNRDILFKNIGSVYVEEREKEIHLYYIISELLKNALTHSSEGKIEVKFQKKGRSNILRVENKTSADIDRKGNEGHGRRIMRYRAKALGGTITAELKDGIYTAKLIWDNYNK